MSERYFRLLVDQRILPVLYSSVESAVEQAGFLKAQGRDAVVVDPDGWQIWPPAAERGVGPARVELHSAASYVDGGRAAVPGRGATR
ncbi:MAG: hypothetical protein KY475_06995 [Planctomycetes bacterium]|nr:hypothetical protein [Planctomycetota bacterium]